MLNLLLLAPIWMQLVHLFLADLVWLSAVLLTACVAAEAVGDRIWPRRHPRSIPPLRIGRLLTP